MSTRRKASSNQSIKVTLLGTFLKPIFSLEKDLENSEFISRNAQFSIAQLRENAFLVGVDSAVQQLDGARVQSKGSSSLELATLNLLGLLPPLLGLQGHFALV